MDDSPEPRGDDMAMGMKDFLYKYFGVLNLQNMPEPVLNRFNSWVKKNDFPNKDVKSWLEEFPQTTAGKWTEADLPQISDHGVISDADIERLYVHLRNVFRSMSVNRNDFRNEDANKFIDKYFGPGKLLEDTPLEPAVETNIKNVISQIKDYVRREYREKIDGVLSGAESVNDPKIKAVISNAIWEFRNSKYADRVPEDELNNVDAALEASDNDVPETKLDELRDQAPDIFKTLYKKSAIRDIFKNNDDSKTISNQIDMALGKTDYTGKINEKNYIAPKYKDSRKNPQQWIDSKLKDTYKNVLKKYLTAHRDKVFMKDTSKAIVGTFDEKGIEIKPTDGLNALIEKSDAIVGKLRGKEPFKAAEHLEWLTKKLDAYKKGGLKDDVDGALRWGYQMHRIVKQIIKDAANDDGETEKAKTALEVLSVMQYGTFTSRRKDAVNAATKDMSILSDGKLSWNNNEGIKVVTAAMDKTAGLAIRGTAFLTAGVVNTLRKRGRKVKGDKDLQNLSNTKKASLASDKLAFESEKSVKDDADRITINNNTPIRNSAESYLDGIYGAGNGVRDAKAHIQTHEANMNAQQQIMQTQEGIMEANRDKHEKYEKYKAIVDEVNNIATLVATTRVDRDAIVPEINNKRAELTAKPYTDPITGQPMSPEEEKQHEAQLLAELDALKDKYNKQDAELTRLLNIQANPDAVRNPALNIMSALDADNTAYLNAETAYSTAEAEYDNLSHDPTYIDLNAKMTEYSDATEAIEKAENDMRVRNEEWDNWDEKHRNNYDELMAYWDFLQTGKTKNLFHLSTKRLQSRMDKQSRSDPTKTNMDMRFIKWREQHGYAA